MKPWITRLIGAFIAAVAVAIGGVGIYIATNDGSSSSGFPDASNTGVPAGTSLDTLNGDQTISTPGAVFDAKLVNGCVSVNAANVTIKRSRIICEGISAIFNNSTGLLVEDTEIDCGTDGVGRTGLTPQNYTARRVNAHGCENIMWAETDVLIEDSYLHDPVDYDPVEDPHTDAIQVPVNGSNVTINHNAIYGNYVDGTSFGNSAIQAKDTGTSDITISNNLVAGGGYTVRCTEVGSGTNFNLINNRFSRIFVPTVGGFGPCTGCGEENASGNVYYDTGDPVPLG